MCTRKHSNDLREPSRQLSLEELKALNSGEHVYLSGDCGCLLIVKINGKPKTWKRKPSRVAIPWKYGLWEYGYITESTPVFVPGLDKPLRVW